jgi:hypothetical protein
MHSAPPTDDGPPRRKAVLFCPDCGHQGHPERDFRTASTGTVVCPNCSATVARRSTDRDSAPSVLSPFTAPTALVAGFWRRYTEQVGTWIK